MIPRSPAVAGVLFAVLLASGGGVGWKISGWRAKAACLIDVNEAQASAAAAAAKAASLELAVEALKADIRSQNEAMDKLAAESTAVSQLQAAARQEAEAKARSSAARLAELQQLIAAGAKPDSLLEAYWRAPR